MYISPLLDMVCFPTTFAYSDESQKCVTAVFVVSVFSTSNVGKIKLPNYSSNRHVEVEFRDETPTLFLCFKRAIVSSRRFFGKKISSDENAATIKK